MKFMTADRTRMDDFLCGRDMVGLKYNRNLKKQPFSLVLTTENSFCNSSSMEEIPFSGTVARTTSINDKCIALIAKRNRRATAVTLRAMLTIII